MIPTVGENAEQLELSLVASGNTKDVVTLEIVWQFPMTLNIHFPHDPVILLLVFTKRKGKFYLHKTIHTAMYSSFIFKCSQMEMTQTTLNCEWINTLWRIHTMEHYSAIKRANYQYL